MLPPGPKLIFTVTQRRQILCFRSGVPVTMIGLDVTMKTLISESFLKDLTLRLGDLGKFLKQINDFYASYYAQGDHGYGFPMHDPLAALFLTNPELFVKKKGNYQ